MNRSAGLRHGMVPQAILDRAVPEASAPISGSGSRCAPNLAWGLSINFAGRKMGPGKCCSAARASWKFTVVCYSFGD